MQVFRGKYLVSTLLEQLKKQMPALLIKTDPESCEKYGKDWSGHYSAKPCGIAFPTSTEQCQQLILAANTLKLPLVPSAGRTGLSGGAVAEKQECVVSVEKLNGLGDIDLINKTVTCGAGVITQALQEHARAQGFFYPISLASEGSCCIGGNIATNAGGIRVLRYGLTRNYVAGLTVVTGAGYILKLNRGLVKNTVGYDLRHLFIGSEGTLGIITEAIIKLTTPPKPSQVMLLAVPSVEAITKLFALFQKKLTLLAYEYFSDLALEKVMAGKQLKCPLDSRNAFYVLLEYELDGAQVEENALGIFETGLEAGNISDGVISQNETQAKGLWIYREVISETIAAKKPYKNDISVMPSQIPALMQALDQILLTHYPDYDIIWYGHIGDGNCHLNILKADNISDEAFVKSCSKVNAIVFKTVEKFGGSISAEHGVGLLKQPYLSYSRRPEEIQYLQQIKTIFDPNNILNPGKLLG